MGWFAKRRENVEDRALTRQTVPPSMLADGRGEAPGFTPSSALRIGDVFACARVLADAAASVPLIAYRRTTDGRARVDGGVADLLSRPAPAVTQSALIGQLMAHVTLWGSAYLGKFRDGQGRVDQLALLHPDRVTPELKGGRPIYTVTGGKGERSTHGVEDVIHVRAPLSLDGLTGLSPIKQCRLALGVADGLATHAEAFFRHGARPSGILRVGAQTTPQDPAEASGLMEAMATSAHESHGGARNAHKIAVVTGDVEFVAISGPLDDLQFVEQRRLSTAEIARCFRVPPWMIGADTGDSMTYSNTESQALAFVTHSLRPWLVAIEQAISADDDLAPGGLYVEFLLDALLRADSKTRSEVYALALDPDRGYMTRSEVRRLENLPAEPDSPAPTTPRIA